jgi:cytochrome c biogenesis protein CcdA
MAVTFASVATLAAVAGGSAVRAEDGTAAQGATVVSSIARGVATGFVSAPCAGLVRGLNLTGAPLQGASDEVLLLTFAGGRGTSLAEALLGGGRSWRARTGR